MGMDRSTNGWRTRAIVRSLRELQEERTRLGRIVERLGDAVEDTGRNALYGRQHGGGAVILARTGIWAAAMLAAVGIVAYTLPQLLGPGSVEYRFADVPMPSASVARPAPTAGPVPDVAWPAGVAPSPPPLRASEAVSVPQAPVGTSTKATPPTAHASAEDMLAFGSMLTGVRPAPADDKARPVGVVYFDPRCPYCHAAWGDLADKGMDLLWLPVPALGTENPGSSRVAAVLGRASDGKSVLENAFGTAPASAVMTPDLQAKADENTAGFLALARGWPQEIEGVPAFVIRGSDGQVHIGSGWPPPPGLLAASN
jgi:hypothetical protein